jgi:methyl-accepting chemotaxis protein
LVPGILTGLGILGTFLGIVDGLDKVDVKDLLAIGNKSSQSLNDLFDGVKTCFKTSALGITLSLVFSSILAKIYRSSEELFDKHVIQVIDSYFKRHTEADSIYELIRLGKEMRESLTTTLIKLSAEIPLKIAEQLNPAFKIGFSSIVTSVDGLKAPMENLGKNTGEKMGDGIGLIIDELVKKVGQTTTSQLDAVRNEFSVLTDKIQTIVMTTSTAVESLSSKMQDADRVFAKVADISKSIDMGQKNSQEVSLKMEKIASTIASMGVAMVSNGENFGNNIKYAKDDVEQTAKITKELSEHVKNMSIQISSLVDGMSNVLIGAERTAQLSNKTVERYVQNTDKINTSLESLSYQASLVEKSAVEISKSVVPVEKIVEGLTNGLSVFKETMGNLSNVGPLVSSLNGMVIKVDDYTKSFTESMKQVATSTASFSDLTNSSATELEKVSRDFQQALVEFSNIFGRITPQYDKLMSDGITKLNGSINQLQISLQDIIESKQDS